MRFIITIEYNGERYQLQDESDTAKRSFLFGRDSKGDPHAVPAKIASALLAAQTILNLDYDNPNSK